MNRREREKRSEGKASARKWAEEQQQGFEPTAIKLPEGTEFYKQEDGRNTFDVIPYKVKRGKAEGGNPRADAGFLHFEREYEVHRIPGTGKFANPYCCRKKCFGKKCAACDWLVKHGGTASEELVQQIRGQLRHLWIVNDKPGKSDNKLKVFDSNHYNRGLGFGQQMVEAVNAQLSEDEDFSDLRDGKTVTFNVDGKYKKVTRVDFKSRDYKYSKDILAHGIDLDDVLIDPGYEAVAELLTLGEAKSHKDEDEKGSDGGSDAGSDGGSDGDDDEPKAKKKTKSKPVNDDDDDDDGDSDGGSDGNSDADSDGDSDAGSDGDSDSGSDGDDDEPSAKKPAKKTAKVEDDDDDPDGDSDGGSDDDDDDEPKAKKPGKKKGPVAEDSDIKEGDTVKVIKGEFAKKLKGKELEVAKVSGDGTSLTLEDADGDEYNPVGPEEVQKVEDDGDDDDDPPAKKKGKAPSKSKSSDDDDDDEPAPKKKGKAKPSDDDDDDGDSDGGSEGDDDDAFDDEDEDD